MPGRESDFADVYFLEVSPAFMQTMGIRLVDGRDLGPADIASGEAGDADVSHCQ